MTRLPEDSQLELVEMDDGVRLSTRTTGPVSEKATVVVMVHGGPGLPDYLGPAAAAVDDVCRVHRYDQRGTGGSTWDGEHTISRHVRDLELLLDAWGYGRVVLVGQSWFPDHADPQRAWGWAQDAARTRRPINYVMNTQLNTDKRQIPLESQVERLRVLQPPATAIIGGDGDPRPAALLRDFADQLGCDVTIIPAAGHEPWLEQPTAFRTALLSTSVPI